VSLSESIDTTSASGRMVFKMLAVLAEFERELLSERTSSAMRQMVKRGERVGRYAQFGYRLSPGGAMRECPEEQNVVAMIRRLAAAHLDAAAIARQLNSMGVMCRSRLCVKDSRRDSRADWLDDSVLLRHASFRPVAAGRAE
jgi:DNA invertase Pin-like site-specific DNA recombinase